MPVGLALCGASKDGHCLQRHGVVLVGQGDEVSCTDVAPTQVMESEFARMLPCRCREGCRSSIMASKMLKRHGRNFPVQRGK